MSNSFALITGGSSGIGFEIAKDLATRGEIMIGTSINDHKTIYLWGLNGWNSK